MAIQEMDIKTKAGKMLTGIAGYVSTQTMGIGVSTELFAEMAKHPDGVSITDLAKLKNFDNWYLTVWIKAAYGAELIESVDGENFKLAKHVETLMLDREFPGYIGGIPHIMLQSEMFGTFEENMKSGKRI